MSGFSADWLRLREPFDAAARDASLVTSLAGAAGTARDVVDLGAGAGANLRYMAPLLGGAQRWLLVDDDARLLEAALRATQDWAAARGARVAATGAELRVEDRGFQCTVRCLELDLARDLATINLPHGALVTGSALLDLVSADWLATLAARCHAAAADVAFALSYDGRTTCMPQEPEDGEVLELFNRHQIGDKGFGAALGPTAARAAEVALAARGYRVTATPSDWYLEKRDAALALALVDGWHDAALELAPQRRAALAGWRQRRRAHAERAGSQIVVGHVDLIGRR